jgi:hypothetical protein
MRERLVLSDLVAVLYSKAAGRSNALVLQARACVRAGEQWVMRDCGAWQASVRVADRSVLSALTYIIGILAAASVVVYAAYNRGHEVLACLSFLAYWSEREREREKFY